MKVAVLAGGRGTRLGALGRPKALARIGEHSVLWHVLARYLEQGHGDAVVALGHRAELVCSELRHDFPEAVWRREGDSLIATFPGNHGRRVRLVDTGEDTETTGRLLALRPFLAGAPFFLNWTDVLSDLDYDHLVASHDPRHCLTMVAARPPARFGRMEIAEDGGLEGFAEKDRRSEGWVNAGTSVVAPEFYDYCISPNESFETGPVARAVAAGAAGAYRHEGFWQCMDYPHEHRELDERFRRGDAPWRAPLRLAGQAAG